MTDAPADKPHVCFDASPLIRFTDIGRLDLLGEWFPRAYTADVIIEDEIKPHLRRYPRSQAILDAEWLEPAAVDDPEDLALTVELHKRFGRAPSRDRGECEVVVLSKRHGWVAVIDDSEGQRAARDYGVACCTTLTMVLVAASAGRLSPPDAWKLHRELEASGSRGRSALTGNSSHRPAFDECIRRFRRIAEVRELAWPEILAVPGVDDLVVKTRNAAPAGVS